MLVLKKKTLVGDSATSIYDVSGPKQVMKKHLYS